MTARTPPGREDVEGGVESTGELFFLGVHGDAQGLKDARGDVAAATRGHRDRPLDRLGEFIRGPRLAFEDGPGDDAGEAILTVRAQQSDELVLVEVAEELAPRSRHAWGPSSCPGARRLGMRNRGVDSSS